PDVDGHEEGFCVKIVEGVLSVWKHSTPSFFTSQGLGSSSTRRNFLAAGGVILHPPAGGPRHLPDA
ncbi:hypothetical protein CSW47_11670, partial [Thermus scotoductus]